MNSRLETTVMWGVGNSSVWGCNAPEGEIEEHEHLHVTQNARMKSHTKQNVLLLLWMVQQEVIITEGVIEYSADTIRWSSHISSPCANDLR